MIKTHIHHNGQFRAIENAFRFFTAICALFMALFLISCANGKSDKSINTLIIKHVNLISMESDRIIPDQSIVIKDQTISYVGPSDKIPMYPKDARVIDATGKFLVPGLCDMHMHIDHPDVLKVFLAYGITTVMNYRGLPEHLVLRERARQNEIVSPAIYTTGDYMEGYPATMPGFLSFDDVSEARKSVWEQKQSGYDFIKVYRNLDSVMHEAICDEATNQDLTVVGHLSPDISLEKSLDAGQKVIAHTEELMYYFDNQNDTSRIDDLVNLLDGYDITYTPNLGIFRSLFLQVEKLDSLNTHDHLQYLQPALFQSWRKEYNYNYPRGPEWAQFMRDRFAFLQMVTSRIKDKGIQVLASTDAPTSGAFPGISLHQELEELVEVGFTPFEALRTATVEPGVFIGKHVAGADSFGMIRKGYRADLLLLDANPLENIANTRSINSVIRNGQYFSNTSLKTELNSLNRIYRNVDIVVRSIEEAVMAGRIEEAYTLFRQAKETYPNQDFLGYYTMWYAGYRFLYENRGLTENPEKAEKALTFYQMYQEEYPGMHGSHYLLGLAHIARKDTLNAKKSFNESLRLHPYNPYARRQLQKLH